MTITEHFFGLIQCYSEQGICNIGNYDFNIMLIIPLYILVITIILGCLYAIWFPFRKYLWWDTPKRDKFMKRLEHWKKKYDKRQNKRTKM